MKQCLGLIGLVGLFWAGEANAANLLPWKKNEPNLAQFVPLDEIPDKHRESAKFVTQNAVLCARGPAETFLSKTEHYQFFLDNPDKAVTAWRRLGAKCVSINAKGQQQFSWTDDNGSEVVWETILKTSAQRVWYAEGKVRPGPNLPLVPVKVMVVLRHNQSVNKEGTSMITHQSDLFIHTDSKALNLLTRMLGPSAKNLAEQGLGQLQMFFAGVSYYLDRHPDQVSTLTEEER